ncbi:DUF3159 domain-containing protein [Actinoplanes derwentensis]|uniref:Intracellular septation protein A n=1 Tax=Actinoplanes derwentensis TaxID=113562 RepID=A0A1H2D6I3_9ACTN|nr:DUF3159 domain-containing protein [Actinoplanes derwentensis]GID85674.1 hypothetical protein Ade03nite_45980 [Actinoplanes derwentensis]SDT78072.1 Protein of unknown function [Actinoplanes derwentensis]
MSGTEPRHVAHESVEERLSEVLGAAEEKIAEEIIAEHDLHEVKPPAKAADDEEEPFPSMSEQIAEQLGGVRGLIESSVPVLAFVLLNVILSIEALGLEKREALLWAIIGSVGSALVIGGVRLFHKQPVRHAVNGLFGIALGAWLAWRTGDAKNFYLPGILLTFGQAAALLVSVAIRKPLIGYAWGIMANKGRQDWFGNARLFRTFQWLTVFWAASLSVRAGIQAFLYWLGEANAIGVVRILVSWPIYAATFALTIWAIHRVTSAQKQETAAAAG